MGMLRNTNSDKNKDTNFVYTVLQNTYKEENSYYENYHAIATDVAERVSFFNKMNSTVGETTPQQSQDIYKKMMNSNKMIPGYSPLSELYTYEKFVKAGEYAGLTGAETADKYNLTKHMVQQKAIKETVGSSLGGGSGLIGSSIYEFTKNNDKVFNSLLNDPNAQSLLSSKNKKKAVAFATENNPVSYDNFGEYLTNSEIPVLQRVITTNLYHDYIVNGGKPNDFKTGQQLVNTLQSSVAIDTKNKQVDVYGVSPILSLYENLHDVNFWKTQIDSEQGFAYNVAQKIPIIGPLTELAVSTGEHSLGKQYDSYSMAMNFMNAPLYAYLTDNTYSEFDRDRLTEFNQALSDTTGIQVINGDVDAFAKASGMLLSTYLKTDNKVDFNQNLYNSPLGLFIHKATNDKSTLAGIEHNNIALDPSVTKRTAHGVDYVFSELGSISNVVYQGISAINPLNREQEVNTQLVNDYIISGGVNSTSIVTRSNDVLDLLDAVDHVAGSGLPVQAGKDSVSDFVFNKSSEETSTVSLAGVTVRNMMSTGAYNTGFNENMIKETRKYLTDEQNKTISDDLILSVYNSGAYNTVWFAGDAMEKSLNQFVKDGVITDKNKEDILTQISDNQEFMTKLHEDRLNIITTSNKALQESWLYPTLRKFGETNTGLKGFEQAYEEGINSAGKLESLIAEFVFDPTTYIGVSEARELGSGVKSGAKFLKSGNRKIIEDISKTFSDEIAQTLTKKQGLDFALDQNRRVSEVASSYQNLWKNLNKDLKPSDFVDESTTNAFNNVQRRMLNMDLTLSGINRKVKENISKLETHNYTNLDELKSVVDTMIDDSINLEKQIDDTAVLLSDDLTTLLEYLPDSNLKTRLNEYITTFSKNATERSKGVTKVINKLKTTKQWQEPLQKDIEFKLQQMASTKGIKGLKTLEGTQQTLNVILKELDTFVMDDGKSLISVLDRLHNVPSVKQDSGIANVINGFVEILENKYLTTSKNVDFTMNVESKVPDSSRLLAPHLTSGRRVNTGVRHLDKALIDRITNSEYYQKNLKDGLARFTTQKYSDKVIDGVETTLELESVVRNSFDRAMKRLLLEVKRSPESVDNLDVLLAHFSTRDVIYELGKMDILDNALQYLPTYKEVLKSQEDIILDHVRNVLNIDGVVTNKELPRLLTSKLLKDGVDYEVLQTLGGVSKKDLLELIGTSDYTLKSVIDLVPTSVKGTLSKSRLEKLLTDPKLRKTVANQKSSKLTDTIELFLKNQPSDVLELLLPKNFEKAVKEFEKLRIDAPLETIEDVLDFVGQRSNKWGQNYYNSIFDKFADDEAIQQFRDFETLKTILNTKDEALRFINNLKFNPITKINRENLRTLATTYLDGKGTTITPSIHGDSGFNTELFNTIFNKYGFDKYKGYADALDQIGRNTERDLFSRMTGFDSAEESEQVFNMMAERTFGKSNLEEVKHNSLAKFVKSKTAPTSKITKVHDQISEAWKVSKSGLNNSVENLLTMQKQIRKKTSLSRLSDLLYAKNLNRSHTATTASFRELYESLVKKGGKNIDFTTNETNMRRMVASLNKTLIHKTDEGVETFLGDIFKFSFENKGKGEFGEEIYNLRGALQSGIKNEELSDLIDVFTTHNTANMKQAQNIMMPALERAVSDIFDSANNSMLLIDEATNKAIESKIDDELNDIRELVGHTLFDEFIAINQQVHARGSSLIMDTFESFDNGLDTLLKSDYAKYKKDMLKRAGEVLPEDGDGSVFYGLTNQTDMRTFLKPGLLKKVAKKKGNNFADDSIMFLDPARASHQVGAIQDSTTKGSYSAQKLFYQKKYNTQANPLLTNIGEYTSAVAKQSMKEIVKTKYGSELPYFVKQASNVALKKRGMIEVPIATLAETLFHKQPAIFDDVVDTINKQFGTKLETGTGFANPSGYLYFDKKVYNYLTNQGIMLNKVTDPVFLQKALTKINGLSHLSYLIGTLNAKLATSAYLLTSAMSGMNFQNTATGMVKVLSNGKSFNKIITKNADAMKAFREIGQIKKPTLAKVNSVIDKTVTNPRHNRIMKLKYQLDNLKLSGSTTHNYKDFKPVYSGYKDALDYKVGPTGTIRGTTKHMLTTAKNGLMPNFSVLDPSILTRALELSNNPKKLNRILKNEFGEKLGAGATQEELHQSAMRVAESGIGMTDGMFANNSSKWNAIFFFRNQIMYGVPNLLATYFGSVEGYMSTINYVQKIKRANQALTGMNSLEYNANISADDRARLMLGYNMGNTDKTLVLNTFSPLDIINQYASGDSTPMQLLFDSLSPIIKYPLQLANKDELGSYNMSDSNVDMYADALAGGDTAKATKYAVLGALESVSGNMYRWTNQMHNLISGKTNDGKDLYFAPGGTDAEINLINSFLYQYDIKVKDGYIDNLPIISTLFNSNNLNSSKLATTISQMGELLYNDRYMDALGNDENTQGIRDGLWGIYNRRMLFDVMVNENTLIPDARDIIEDIVKNPNTDARQKLRKTLVKQKATRQIGKKAMQSIKNKKDDN